MSELAFDKDGEPMEFDPEAELLRVRRFRNPGMRGTCETVRNDEGAPLYVSPDTTYLELKKMVGGVAGYYRLDQCDDRRNLIADAQPAYVSISEGHRNSSAMAADDTRDVVIRELVRANSEMCRTMAEQFSDVMKATAEILRAADGAGLPRREPAPAPAVVEEEKDNDAEDEDDDEVDPQSHVWSLIEEMIPTIKMWIAAKVAERSAPPPPAATPAPAPVAPTPVPAPAAARSSAPAQSSVAAGVSPASSSTTAATEPAPAETRNAAPTPEQWVHLLAIREKLSPREAGIAEAVVTRMTPDLRAQWLAELSALSVDQAVEIVRSMIPKPAGTPASSPGENAPSKDGT